MVSDITELDARREIKRLEVIYGPRKDVDELSRAWVRVLAGVPVTAVMRAVTEYCESPAIYFPKPGQVKTAAREIEARSFGDRPVSTSWDQTNEGPCPVCGAVLQLVADPLASKHVYDPATGWRARTDDDPPPQKRYGVIHDREAHRRAGARIVGRAH